MWCRDTQDAPHQTGSTQSTMLMSKTKVLISGSSCIWEIQKPLGRATSLCIIPCLYTELRKEKGRTNTSNDTPNRKEQLLRILQDTKSWKKYWWHKRSYRLSSSLAARNMGQENLSRPWEKTLKWHCEKTEAPSTGRKSWLPENMFTSRQELKYIPRSQSIHIYCADISEFYVSEKVTSPTIIMLS